MTHIITICGSPSEQSRSETVIDYLKLHLKKDEYTCEEIQLTDLPTDVLMKGIYGHPVINQLTQQINLADGIIICCPVYKGAYPGVLKAFLDLLPQNIFQGKVVYPLMVGGTRAHLLALEFTLKPLLQQLKGECLSGVFILESELKRGVELSSSITNQKLAERVHQQLTEFTEKIIYKRGVHV